MVIVVGVPTWTHAVPFADRYAVKTFPLRTSRTQYGAAPVEPSDGVVAPGVSRHWNPDVPRGRISIIAYGESAERSCRIMTPALA